MITAKEYFARVEAAPLPRRVRFYGLRRELAASLTPGSAFALGLSAGVVFTLIGAIVVSFF